MGFLKNIRVDFKITIFFILLSLVTLSSFIIINNFLDAEQTDRKIINMAGNQRMLLHKMSKESFEVVYLNKEDMRESLQETVYLFEHSLNNLLYGNNEIPAPNNEKIVDQLSYVKTLWEPFSLLVKSIANNEGDTTKALILMEEASEPLFFEMDRAVTMIEQSNERAATAKAYIIITTAIIILLSLGGWFFFYTTITKPIKHLATVTNEISKGNFDVNRLSLSQNDEIGHLSTNINNLIESINNQLNKASHDKLIQFINDTSDAILILDSIGTVIFANPGCKEIFGWNPQDIEGTLYLNLPGDVKGERMKLYERIKKGEIIKEIDSTRQTVDGEVIYVNITFIPLYNKEKEIISFAGMARNITKRVQIEKELENTKQDLINTVREQQGLIFKYHKVNGEFIHTLCDGNLLSQIGLKQESVLDKSLYNFLPPKTAEDYEGYYKEAWNGKTVSFNTRGKRNRHYFIQLKPIIHKGKVVEVIGSTIDITKLKQTEELLNKSEKLALVGEMAAGVAHEIRNPLTALKGFVQLMDTDTSESKQKEFIHLMLSEIDRIEMITNEFMVMSKPQAVQFQENKIEGLIQHVLSFLKPQAILHNVQFITDIQDDLPPLNCEGNQLKQVFINIIKNAMEAMEEEGEGKVTIHAHCKDEYLSLTFRDNGCGIPKDVLPKLGEPFYTLKEKGTGLGVMVTKRIIEAHQGEIHFSSEIGVGTSVEIILPFVHRETPMYI